MGVENRLSRRDLLRSVVAVVAGVACEHSLRGEDHGGLAEAKDEGWALENELIQREVGFRPGGVFIRNRSRAGRQGLTF